MRKILKLLFGAGSSTQTTMSPSGDVLYPGEEVPRYPPFAAGLPMVSPKDIVATQADLIQRIKQTLGLTTKEFDDLIMPQIEMLASLVHLLPASRQHHHRNAGGLFRHSLEVACFAAQFAQGKIFSYGKTPLERKEEEPRWVVAAFTAALLHDIGKAATDVVVTSADSIHEWPAYNQTLWDWGQEHKIKRYFIRWQESRHKNHEFVSIPMVRFYAPQAVLGWLGSNSNIIKNMLAAVSGEGDHALTEIVKRADSTSVQKDMSINKDIVSDTSMGVPVERHLIDACRRLISNGDWGVNVKGSRIWVVADSVYIVWKYAVNDILKLLEKDNVPGIPKNMDTLADILIERGIAEPSINEEKEQYRYWNVSPELISMPGSLVWLKCLKLTNPGTFFNPVTPPSIEALIYSEGGDIKAAARAEVQKVKKALSGKQDQKAKSESDDQETAASSVDTPNKLETEIEALKSREAQKAPLLKVESNKKEPSPDLEAQAKRSGISMPGTKTSSGEPDKPRHAPSKLKERKPEEHQSELDLSPENQVTAQKAPTEAWVKTQPSDAVQIISDMAKAIKSKESKFSDLFVEFEGQWAIPFPHGVKPYGKPIEVMNTMFNADWVEPDPANPSKKVRELSDGKGLFFHKEVGSLIVDHVQQIAGMKAKPAPSSEAIKSERNPAANKPSKPVDAPVSRSEPSQESMPGKPPQRKKMKVSPLISQIIERLIEKVFEDGSEIKMAGPTSIAGDDQHEIRSVVAFEIIPHAQEIEKEITGKPSQIPFSQLMKAFPSHPQCSLGQGGSILTIRRPL